MISTLTRIPTYSFLMLRLFSAFHPVSATSSLLDKKMPTSNARITLMVPLARRPPRQPVFDFGSGRPGFSELRHFIQRQACSAEQALCLGTTCCDDQSLCCGSECCPSPGCCEDGYTCVPSSDGQTGCCPTGESCTETCAELGTGYTDCSGTICCGPGETCGNDDQGEPQCYASTSTLISTTASTSTQTQTSSGTSTTSSVSTSSYTPTHISSSALGQPTQTQAQSSNNSNAVKIAGGTIAGLIILGLFLVVVWYSWRRQRLRGTSRSPSPMQSAYLGQHDQGYANRLAVNPRTPDSGDFFFAPASYPNPGMTYIPDSEPVGVGTPGPQPLDQTPERRDNNMAGVGAGGAALVSKPSVRPPRALNPATRTTLNNSSRSGFGPSSPENNNLRPSERAGSGNNKIMPSSPAPAYRP